MRVIDRQFWGGRRRSATLSADLLLERYTVSNRTTAYYVLRTLRFLGLIDTGGRPTASFAMFYEPFANRKELLAQALRRAYAPVFELLLKRGSVGDGWDVDEAFKLYPPLGAMFAPAVALFRDLCRECGGVRRVMTLPVETAVDSSTAPLAPGPIAELATAPLPTLLDLDVAQTASPPVTGDTSQSAPPGTVATITVNAERVEVSGPGHQATAARPLPPSLAQSPEFAAQPITSSASTPSRRSHRPGASPRPVAPVSTTQRTVLASNLVPQDALPPWSPQVSGDEEATANEVEELAGRFAQACRDYGIKLAGIDIAGAVIGPRVLRIPIGLAPGETISHLQKLLVEISLSVRREGLLLTPMPARGYIALDVPRSRQFMVPFVSEGLPSLEAADSSRGLPFALGVSPEGSRVVGYFGDDMPHLLVGGETGAGKSEFLRVLLVSCILSQPDVQILLSSSKRFDFRTFEGAAQLVGGQIYSVAGEAITTIKELTSEEISRRGTLLDRTGCFSIAEYNRRNPGAKESSVLIVIDELAHLAGSFTGTKRERAQSRDEFYSLLLQVAAVGRAYGIHLVVGTQRPSAELLPTDLRSQLSGRVALKVSDPQSSEMIIGMRGAERLQKPGDALCLFDGQLLRVQGYFIEQAGLISLLLKVQLSAHERDAIRTTTSLQLQAAGSTVASVVLV